MPTAARREKTDGDVFTTTTILRSQSHRLVESARETSWTGWPGLMFDWRWQKFNLNFPGCQLPMINPLRERWWGIIEIHQLMGADVIQSMTSIRGMTHFVMQQLAWETPTWQFRVGSRMKSRLDSSTVSVCTYRCTLFLAFTYNKYSRYLCQEDVDGCYVFTPVCLSVSMISQ